GHLPQLGDTTTITAPVIPVSVDLLAADGSVRFHVDANRYLQPVLNSPVLQNATYSSSGAPTQFTDAIQRAEYASSAKSDWHTLLHPVVEPAVTLHLPYRSSLFARWISGPNAGQIAVVLLDPNTLDSLMFPSTFAWPPDNSTVMGTLEASGEITPHDITTFLFPNIFLSDFCCSLFTGFHSVDYESGDASNGNRQREFVYTYVNWVSPAICLFVCGDEAIQDVSTLSHETSEIFNDPFIADDGVHNITPWWSSGGGCLDYLETGDVVEGLPRPNALITMNGMTYHLQTEALLQWFEGMTPSDATGGAYSYPDPSILPTANPANTPLNCGR